MKRLVKWCLKGLMELVSPKPNELGAQHHSEQIVTILRQSFTPKEQNEIILRCARMILELREKDMSEMDNNYQDLKSQTSLLRDSLVLQ